MAAQLSIGLAVSASVLQLAAYATYSRRVIRGLVQPNFATWSIWGLIILLNASSYLVMSADWVKSLLPLANAAGCLITAGVVLSRARKSPLGLEDKAALGIAVLAAIVWSAFSAAPANLVVQICFVVGFVPTYRSVLAHPSREAPMPWFLWSAAYVLSTTVVILRWTGRYEELIYPALSVIWHLGVALLSLRPDQERRITVIRCAVCRLILLCA